MDWVEVSFGGFPLFGDFHEDGGDQAQAALGVWKDGGDTSSASDLFVEGFAEIGGSKAFSYCFVEGEGGEAFVEIDFHPSGELRGRVRVFFDSLLEFGLGGGEVFCVEYGTNIRSDSFLHALLWNIGLGVLLEVELAAIPRHIVIGRGDGGLEPLVSVTGDGGAGV